MISDWKIDILGLQAVHVSGTKIKLVPATDEVSETWQIEPSDGDKLLLEEGIACYEHASAKQYLEHYLSKNNLSLEELIKISNDHCTEKGYRERLTVDQLKSYLSDQALFPINAISIIRAAVYFYRKDKNQN
ncbi:hypothetical protein [Gynuella sp.]|uniref:hypothetical protein n=1 Tax=Gynuella sp. TaxID=2969146 RepID=UPI003D0DEBB2